ncbi:hypothetical protein AMS58_07105 [Pseudoalteromonas porphyrae]|uniref:hypothetical protein n=1 Tax=Pseudoalteromonas porphyrae TaxID=187330 RepID=UPI0006BB1E10|nr:hypothetical protein [Pseudoalteromonas porphyrae]KPH95484.1 hypothetical protein AMS58_07105 [Pseudoalteromonas porphyrae]
MEFKKSLLALSVVAVLSGCGGSSDNKKPEITDPVVTDPVTPVVSEAQVKGVASKGTLKNAQLTFYKYENGEAIELTADELGDSSLVTDETGHYSVSLKGVAGLVKVKVSASQDTASPTIMVCDAPVGCGKNEADQTIAYGDDVNLTVQDPEFSLTSILNLPQGESNSENTSNITPLTHIATELAQSRGAITEQTISDAHSQIANVFGLIGALNSLAPTAIENPSAILNEENISAVRYALINAGIANALYSDAGTDNVSAKLSSAITDLVAADGGILVTNAADDDDEFEFSVEDVLSGAEQATLQLIEIIKKDPQLVTELSGLDALEQLVTNLVNEKKAKAAEAGDSGRIKGKVSDQTQGDAIAKAAAMVNDIRLFANLFDVTKSSGADFESEGEKFVSLVESAGDMVAEQGDSFALLSDVIEAITQINQQRQETDNSATMFDLKDYLSTGGTGTVILDEENLTFKVTAAAGTESLTLDIAINALQDNQQYQLALSGMAENDAVKFEITQGSHATISLDRAVTRAQIEAGGVDAEPIKGELSLTVELAQKSTETVTNPISFKGALTGELLPVDVYSADTSNYDAETAWDYTLEQDTLILPKMVSLSGEFSSLQGEMIKATATVNIKDLAAYTPPELKGFGKLKEDIAAVVVNEANSQLSLSVNNDETVTDYTYSKTSEQAGNWKIEAQRTTDIEGYFQGEFKREVFTFDGVQYYYYNFHNTNNDQTYGFVEYIEQSESSQLFVIRQTYQYFTDYRDGVLTTKSGNEVNVDELHFFRSQNEFFSYDEAVNNLLIRINADPATLNNISDYFNNELNGGFGVAVGGEGDYRLINDDAQISAGANVDLDAYLVSPILDELLTISVSNNANNLTATVEGSSSQDVVSVVRTDEFNVSVNSTRTYSGGESTQSQLVSSSKATALGDELLVASWRSYNQQPTLQMGQLYRPIDTNADQIADHYQCYGAVFSNEAGEYVDGSGQLIDFDTYESYCGEYESLASAIRYDSEIGSFGINSNFATFTAVDVFTAQIGGFRGPWLPQPNEGDSFQARTFYGYVDGLGKVAADFTRPEHMDWAVDGEYKIDMYLAQPELGTVVEDEDTFLDINAALNVQVKVGEYNLDLNLSGERTDLDDGKLALDVKYQLPNSDKQRSFMVKYDTKLETLSAVNAENVTLMLAESDGGDTAEQVLGTIMVGDEKAAEIVKREGLVLIVYTNGTVESL